jgi:hypothetical protein
MTDLFVPISHSTFSEYLSRDLVEGSIENYPRNSLDIEVSGYLHYSVCLSINLVEDKPLTQIGTTYKLPACFSC